MGVKIRKYAKSGKGEALEVDLTFKWPDGSTYRERVKSPVTSKSGARAWGEQRIQELLREGKEEHARPVPTFAEFAPQYMQHHVKANRQKPSTASEKDRIIEFHLLPRFGQLRLDEINEVAVQRLKGELSERSAKTVNNVLVVLNTMLKTAVKWSRIQRLPVSIELLKTTPTEMSFYEPHQFEQLVDAAEKISHQHYVMVLLGGDAGLRLGEIIALEQSHVDFVRGVINVQKSETRGHTTAPKSGRHRQVNMTERLKSALLRQKHLNGDRVLWRNDGFPKVTGVLLAKWMRRIQRRAGLEVTGALHILRHTFCSRMAMAGAASKAIQELAGHQNLSTTQRHMHLSPAAKSEAIGMLEKGSAAAKLAVQEAANGA